MITKKFIHNHGRLRGKLNQNLLYIDLNYKFKKGELHPQVSGIVFHGYRENGKQRWQTVEQYEDQLEYQKLKRVEARANEVSKDPSIYTGLNKGCIPQKLFQTGLADLKPGYPHPTLHGYVFIKKRKRSSNPEQWGTKDQLEKIKKTERERQEKKRREKGVRPREESKYIVLQTGNPKGTFKRGDPHPTQKAYVYIGWESSRGKEFERWGDKEQLEKKKIAEKIWRKKNKEKKRATDKAYRESNKEVIKSRKKAYYDSNKDKIRVKHKAYYDENKENLAKTHKVWYEKNKSSRLQYAKEYRDANAEKVSQAKKKSYFSKKEQGVSKK